MRQLTSVAGLLLSVMIEASAAGEEPALQPGTSQRTVGKLADCIREKMHLPPNSGFDTVFIGQDGDRRVSFRLVGPTLTIEDAKTHGSNTSSLTFVDKGLDGNLDGNLDDAFLSASNSAAEEAAYDALSASYLDLCRNAPANSIQLNAPVSAPFQRETLGLIRSDGEIFCGAYALDPRHVVTAAHCYTGEPLGVIWRTDQDSRESRVHLTGIAQPLYIDRAADIAIFEPDALIQIPKARVPTALAGRFDFLAIGHAYGMPWVTTSWAGVQDLSCEENSCTLPGNILVLPGMSGGPVFAADGSYAGFMTAKSVGGAILIADARAFLMNDLGWKDLLLKLPPKSTTYAPAQRCPLVTGRPVAWSQSGVFHSGEVDLQNCQSFLGR